jgi:hypothetical protein
MEEPCSGNKEKEFYIYDVFFFFLVFLNLELGGKAHVIAMSLQ